MRYLKTKGHMVGNKKDKVELFAMYFEELLNHPEDARSEESNWEEGNGEKEKQEKTTDDQEEGAKPTNEKIINI